MSSILTARYQRRGSHSVVIRREVTKNDDALSYRTSDNFGIARNESVKPSIHHNFTESIYNPTRAVDITKINQDQQSSIQVRWYCNHVILY